ncbi:MAG: acyltransferase family protein [Chthoniobacterales bacterium]
MKRLLWLDITKGLAILFVVYFHFFRTYFEHGAVPPLDWSSVATGLMAFLELAWFNISDLGFHAVGVFIILSGWVLMQSTERRAASGTVAWGAWYRTRLFRLYPMYWVAHLVYLVSPFTARFEKIDGRIVLSLLGLRFVDISMNFYYLNAAWWYFSMLIQFYLIFPILFWVARKLGPWPFLLGACALGFLVRYLMLIPYPQNGMWVLGGCAICRLPEFALGMALGMWDSHSPDRVQRFLLGGYGLAIGVLLYPAALWLYHNGLTYTFVDFATGGCCFLVLAGLAGLIARFPYPARVIGLVGAFSYGIYLIHQPYVIWLGLRIREQPIWMFLLITLATLTVLGAWGIILERITNSFVNKLTRKTRPSATL